MSTKTYSAYIRKSTDQQSDEHQRADIQDWLESNDVPISEVEFYAETGSGADSTRDQFTDLIESIENGLYKHVVVWEVSRIARKGFLAQRFFDACEENDVTIHITNGSVRRIEPDGTGRLVADIIASVSAEERRNLIRRTRSGQKQARKSGKWIGNPPVGFVVVDGYLKPNLNPDYKGGETGFFDVVEALESVEAGQSYNKTAKQTPNITRQTLSNIHQDEKRRLWYLDGESDDERVQEAIKGVVEPDEQTESLTAVSSPDEPLYPDDYDDSRKAANIEDFEATDLVLYVPEEVDVTWLEKSYIKMRYNEDIYSVYHNPDGAKTDKEWSVTPVPHEGDYSTKEDHDAAWYATRDEALDVLAELTPFNFDWD